jgi:predicted transcriptional regulator
MVYPAKVKGVVPKELLEEMYLKQRLSINKIADELGVSFSSVNSYMKELGIPIRSRRESISKIRQFVTEEELRKMYLEEKMSAQEIADKYNCCNASVLKYMEICDIERRKTREYVIDRSNKTVNENFFKEWNKEVAYVLGVLITDGSIDRATGNIRLSMTDFDVIEAVAKAMDLKGGIVDRSLKKGKPQRLLSICRSNMLTDLIALGLTARDKTLKQRFPDVPTEYRSHFLRGVFDGDGCIVARTRKTPNNYISKSREVTVITTSSLSMAKGVARTLKEELNIEREVYHQIKKNDNRADVYRVNIYNGNDINEFFKYIYQDKEYLYMKRKYEKFLH